MSLLIAGKPVRLPAGSTITRVEATVHYVTPEGEQRTLDVDRELPKK